MKMIKLILAILILLFACAVSFAQDYNENLGTGAGGSNTSGDRNVALGDSALSDSKTGSDNVAIGFNAMGDAGSTHEAKQNICIGTEAGMSMTGSDENVFIGYQAGKACTTGTDIVIVGHLAGVSNNGTDNTFIGTEAGYSNTNGVDNTFIGEEAGFSTTTGDDNTFIGEDAGYSNTTASDNTAIGSTALRSCTTGYRNTAVGMEALYDLTTGYRNTALGDSAGRDISTGHHNTMIGQGAGASTEYADFNTYVGWFAGHDNNRTNNTGDANRNTYVGARAGFTNREGQDNVGIGAFSNFSSTIVNQVTFVGAYSLVNKSDAVAIGYKAYGRGNQSIAIGSEAQMDNGSDNSILMGYKSNLSSADNAIAIGVQDSVTSDNAISIGYEGKITGDYSIGIGGLSELSGANSITIGYNSSASGDSSLAIGPSASVTGKNSIAIGTGVSVSSNNNVVIGNNSITAIGGVVNWSATSDKRVKKNIQHNVPGLDFINSLNPVTYKLDGRKMDSIKGVNSDSIANGAYGQQSQIIYSGFLAQEVDSIAKSMGYEFSGVKIPEHDSSQLYGLRYAEFVVPLTMATQELSQKVESQEDIIDQQYQQILARQALLQQYQAALQEALLQIEALKSKQGEPIIAGQ